MHTCLDARYIVLTQYSTMRLPIVQKRCVPSISERGEDSVIVMWESYIMQRRNQGGEQGPWHPPMRPKIFRSPLIPVSGPTQKQKRLLKSRTKTPRIACVCVASVPTFQFPHAAPRDCTLRSPEWLNPDRGDGREEELALASSQGADASKH
jgi:hypothetical protein